MAMNSAYVAKRGQRLQNSKMIQWVERMPVFKEAERIAERDHLKNLEAFTKLFRNAIALYDTMNQVQAHLKERRKGGVMYTLYDPTPFDVVTFIEEAVTERTGTMVVPSPNPDEGKEDADAPKNKTIQWREEPHVYEEAVKIAKSEGTNNKDTFSMLFRNGIALDGIVQNVRQYLLEQRERVIEQLENSPLEWERREAKNQRLLYSLYEPSDLEVIQFIQDTVQMKIHGKVNRRVSTGGETLGNGAPVDDMTIIIDMGKMMTRPDVNDMTSIRLANHVVNVGKDGIQSFDIPAEQVEGRPACELSFQHDTMYDIKVDGTLACYKSVLNGETGEYDSLHLTDSYEGITPPTSLVLTFQGETMRIDANEGITYHEQATSEASIGDKEARIQYDHYAVRVDKQNDDLSVMLR